MQKILLLFILLILCFVGAAQDVVIKGIVTGEDNRPLEFANVYIEGQFNSATITKADGSYSIAHSNTGELKLCASHVGYQKYCKSVNIKAGVNQVNIELSQSNHSISPVVVTGTGTHHRIDDVPVQTEIITKKDIQEIAGKNIEELISGISSSVDFISSSMGTNIKINGLGADYVLFLLNGKRLTGGIGGYTDLSRIDPDDIEQIEIVKGASSTLYGSDAIAGVINIITKKPSNKITVSNNTRIGAYADVKQLNTFSFSKEKFTSKTSFSYKQTDGWQLNNMEFNSKWESNHDLPFLVETFDKPVNKTRGYTITQNFDYNCSEKLSLNANASWYEKTLYFPFKGRMHNYYYNNRSAAFGGKYKLKKKDYIDFNMDYGNYLYYNEYPWKYNETYITKDDVIKVTYYPEERFKNSEQSIINAQAKGVFHLSAKNKLSTGIEFMRDHLEAQYRLTKPSVTSNTSSVYAQNEWKATKNFELVAGLRAIYHSISGFSLTPKVSAMYKQQRFTHRFTYSKGFKSPTLKELYYYYQSQRMGVYRLYLGNEDLKPQQSHYFSVSSEYKYKKFRTGVNVYLNRVCDMIEYQIIPTAYEHDRQGIEETKKRYNIEDARTLGVDYHFNLVVSPQVTINGGYSYVDASNLTQDIRLNGVSEHSATFKASWTKQWKTNKLNLNVSGVYKSDKFYLEEDLKKMYAEPYQLWKFTANYNIKRFKSVDVNLFGGVDNILNYVDDSPYGSHYGTLNPGRTIFVGLNLKYSKGNN
ncbi:TonB-dependent receptor [Puteibacter caeruleilacunae]|nr:TonB-dependent receptor [Puteibacter caeruleilacunae]